METMGQSSGMMGTVGQLLRNLCPEGVPWVELGVLMAHRRSLHYTVKSTDYKPEYATPVLTACKAFLLGYTDETEGIYEASPENPVILFDDFKMGFCWVDFPFKVKSTALQLLTSRDESRAMLRYLYYAMQGIRHVRRDHRLHWLRVYAKWSVPIPPLAIQQEIVRMLDTFSELEGALKDELQARRKQYEYYQKQLLTFGDEVEWRTLGEVADITGGVGKEFTRHYSDTGTIIALRALNVKGRLDLSQVKYINGSNLGKLARNKLYRNDLLLTCVGSVGRVALVDCDDRYYLGKNLCRIRFTEDVEPRYALHYFQTTLFRALNFRHHVRKSTMENLNAEGVRCFIIPLPPLAVQREIADVLDAFSELEFTLKAELEARRKQYKYYRERLMSFPRPEGGGEG